MVLARRVALVLSLLPGLWLTSGRGFAQPTPADRALATDLFQRGRRALLAGYYAGFTAVAGVGIATDLVLWWRVEVP